MNWILLCYFLYSFQSVSQKWSPKMLALLKQPWPGFNPLRILQFEWLWISFSEKTKEEDWDKCTQPMTERGKGHCPLAQAGLTGTVNDLHVVWSHTKKIEREGEMSQHKSNLVRALVLLCKRETEIIQRSQLQVFRFQSSSDVRLPPYLWG